MKTKPSRRSRPDRDRAKAKDEFRSTGFRPRHPVLDAELKWVRMFWKNCRPSWSNERWDSMGMAVRIAFGLLHQSDAKFEQSSERFLKEDPDALAEIHRHLEQARRQLICVADFIEVIQTRFEAVGCGPAPGSTMAISRRVRARHMAHDIGQKDELVCLGKYSVHDDPDFAKFQDQHPLPADNELLAKWRTSDKKVSAALAGPTAPGAKPH